MLATRNPYLHDEFLLKHEFVLPVFPPITRNPDIEKVIFNDPATIVIWKDKTKTVVKCQEGDTYSPELGLAMCISKKYLGNKGNFNEVFKKWIPEEEPRVSIKKMRTVLNDMCLNLEDCDRCPICKFDYCKTLAFDHENKKFRMSDKVVEVMYDFVFGNKEAKNEKV